MDIIINQTDAPKAAKMLTSLYESNNKLRDELRLAKIMLKPTNHVKTSRDLVIEIDNLEEAVSEAELEIGVLLQANKGLEQQVVNLTARLDKFK